MPDTRKIIINLPESMLREIELVIKEEKKNRSELIREAVRLYLAEHKKAQIREQMKAGYIEMGMLNISLSEEGFAEDCADLERYEKKLVESE